jgi:hypothetical protein
MATPATARCLRCGKDFQPRRGGHVFCSPECRHLGERKPYRRDLGDEDAIARLFDPTRDPDEPVRPDEWCPPDWDESTIEFWNNDYTPPPHERKPGRRYGDTVADRRGIFLRYRDR